MNRILKVIVISVGVFPPFLTQLPAQSIRAKIDFSAKIHRSKQRIEFSGETNLPAGTMIWFRAKPKMESPTIRFKTPSDQIPWGSGSVKSNVKKDGTFNGTLKTSGKVKTGEYICQIEVPIHAQNIKSSSRGQPDDVYKIVGNQGENLTGPLVKRGSGFLGSFCKIELQSTIDFRKQETEQVQQGEKRKYITFLNVFKKGNRTLLDLRRKGVFRDPTNQIAPKWYLAFNRSATDVEFLLSQEAIDHLRKVCLAQEQMYFFAYYPGEKDIEFANAETKYKSALKDFEKFIARIK